MTPDDLARIEAAYAAYGHYGMGVEVPALVAALREAWAERDVALDNLDDERVILGDALRERDEARADRARVEAVCDRQEEYVESVAPEYVSSTHVPVSAIRAALAGPTPTEGDDRA